MGVDPDVISYQLAGTLLLVQHYEMDFNCRNNKTNSHRSIVVVPGKPITTSVNELNFWFATAGVLSF